MHDYHRVMDRAERVLLAVTAALQRTLPTRSRSGSTQLPISRCSPTFLPARWWPPRRYSGRLRDPLARGPSPVAEDQSRGALPTRPPCQARPGYQVWATRPITTTACWTSLAARSLSSRSVRQMARALGCLVAAPPRRPALYPSLGAAHHRPLPGRTGRPEAARCCVPVSPTNAGGARGPAASR